MTMNVRKGGAWKQASAISVRKDGTWKPASSAWIRKGGSWLKFFGGGGSGGTDPLVSTISPSPSGQNFVVSPPGTPAFTFGVSVSPSGGTPPYSYDWSPAGTSGYSAGTNFTQPGEPGNVFFWAVSCTITDSAGRTITKSTSFTITFT